MILKALCVIFGMIGVLEVVFLAICTLTTPISFEAQITGLSLLVVSLLLIISQFDSRDFR